MHSAIGRAGDRDIIVSGGWDHTVRIWDAATGQPLGQPLTDLAEPANAVAIGRAGDRDIIVSGGNDGTVQIWDAATSQPLGQLLTGQPFDQAFTTTAGLLADRTGPVNAVAIGRAGDRDIIVSGGNDGTVQIWDAATSQRLGQPRTLTNNNYVVPVRAVAIGRAGDRDVIVSGGDDNTVRIWDAATGQPLGQPLTGHTRWVKAVAIGRIRNRDSIVSASDDHTVRIWDAATGQPLGQLLTGHIDLVNAVAIGRIRDRDIIVSASSDDTVRIQDTLDGTSYLIDLLGPARSAAVSADGSLLCVSSAHTVCVFAV